MQPGICFSNVGTYLFKLNCGKYRFTTCEFSKKFTVKQIELAIDTPKIPIYIESTILETIFATTAIQPEIMALLVSLNEYRHLNTMSRMPELMKPIAYPIRAALVMANDALSKCPLKYAIETISLEQEQVMIVIGSIMHIIMLMAECIVENSFS